MYSVLVLEYYRADPFQALCPDEAYVYQTTHHRSIHASLHPVGAREDAGAGAMNDSLVSLLRHGSGYRDQIAHVEDLPPRPPHYAEPAAPLPQVLQVALAARGITQLYAHQAAALDAARAGAHLGVVTATASGKTLCYQLPTLEALLSAPASRALFLFPTKALAHDQLRSLEGLLVALTGISAATLDGDTPRPARDAIRTGAGIILSNPDMLHRSLLPDHRRWATWLAQLRFVVLDEAHTYRGVFGTHVALILRRLLRICAHYGSAPQLICCSATSANPETHLSALVGAPVTIIAGDGAPQGARSFVFWNPPLLSRGPRAQSPASTGRRSTNVEAAHLVATLVRAHVKTLAFARSRRGAELILRYTREALESESTELSQRIRAYRAGYRPEERRALEGAFLRGELLGLISTNALELGVDIGGVDAVVIAGYPGTVASTWQQTGRAGREQGRSLAVLVAQDDPLDQFYMRHADQFFARPHEQARIALQNPYILCDQLCCAASELPLHDADAIWFGETMPALRDWLLRQGRLRGHAGGSAVACDRWPAAKVNIRNADGAPVVLRDVESKRIIEQIPASRAPFEIHPGAVYLHQGDTYVVRQLTDQEALAQHAQLGYYTQPRDITDIAIERVIEQRALGPATLCLGVVAVTRQVTGYRRKEHHSEALLSEHDLALPPQTFRTQAVWWTLPEAMSTALARVCGDSSSGGQGLPGALHAMEHAAIGILPLFAQCDRWDIGGLSTALHPDTNAASVFVYDAVPGGVGIAQIGYEQAEAWWTATRDLLRDCPCAEGCPSCVQSPKCGSGNQPLSKEGARLLADALLGIPLPADGRVVVMAAAPAGEQRAVLLVDLRERLARARNEPIDIRRKALLVALRYRLALEQTGARMHDADVRSALDAIDQEAQLLLDDRINPR